jgi:AbrB family looped-hinge helix DNA binding protein
MYKTSITSQGTITLPAQLRYKYGLKVGDIVTIVENNGITIITAPNINNLRKNNASLIKGIKHEYKSGDGLSSYLKEKYGK